MRRIEQEDPARHHAAEHVITLQELRLMARHEVRLLHQVMRRDGPRPETQMRDGDRPGFLRVINKVPCAKFFVSSPMILIEFLFAPTVPSEPSP